MHDQPRQHVGQIDLDLVVEQQHGPLVPLTVLVSPDARDRAPFQRAPLVLEAVVVIAHPPCSRARSTSNGMVVSSCRCRMRAKISIGLSRRGRSAPPPVWGSVMCSIGAPTGIAAPQVRPLVSGVAACVQLLTGSLV